MCSTKCLWDYYEPNGETTDEDDKNTYFLKFANYINKRETALVGKLHGENILEKLKAKGISLRDIEKEFNIIQVVIPSTIISINKSFFLGCFGTRIQELGTEEFRNKYTFDTCAHNKRKIELHLINFK